MLVTVGIGLFISAIGAVMCFCRRRLGMDELVGAHVHAYLTICAGLFVAGIALLALVAFIHAMNATFI